MERKTTEEKCSFCKKRAVARMEDGDGEIWAYYCIYHLREVSSIIEKDFIVYKEPVYFLLRCGRCHGLSVIKAKSLEGKSCIFCKAPFSFFSYSSKQAALLFVSEDKKRIEEEFKKRRATAGGYE